MLSPAKGRREGLAAVALPERQMARWPAPRSEIGLEEEGAAEGEVEREGFRNAGERERKIKRERVGVCVLSAEDIHRLGRGVDED